MIRQVKVLCVLGTRPEAIKMAPLVKELSRRSLFEVRVCVTGQHRQMLQQVMDTFAIRPCFELNVMRKNQSLAGLSARVLSGVDETIKASHPDLVVVQGDTTTALMASVAAFYNKIPVAHVEAGLRTYDLNNPFPEEFNRCLIDRFSSFYYAPTRQNKLALQQEGVPGARIIVTGNTGIDALLWVRKKNGRKMRAAWRSYWGVAAGIVGDRKKPVVLITAHRRESFGAKVRSIFEAIKQMAENHPTWHFIYPIHLNPNVRIPAAELLGGLQNLHIIDPLPYEPFVFLMDRASIILTDSGGIQEEAPSLGKPVVVMRECTERQEAVDAGTVILAGNSGSHLEEIVARLMDQVLTGRVAKVRNPYGDGSASRKISNHLAKVFVARKSNR